MLRKRASSQHFVYVMSLELCPAGGGSRHSDRDPDRSADLEATALVGFGADDTSSHVAELPVRTLLAVWRISGGSPVCE